jgi:hypothetical protein
LLRVRFVGQWNCGCDGRSTATALFRQVRRSNVSFSRHLA